MTNQEAIVWLKETKKHYGEYREKALDMAIKALEERAQGEWGKWIIAEIQCPNCFEYFETDCYSTEELNKCPNCGAKMK